MRKEWSQIQSGCHGGGVITRLKHGIYQGKKNFKNGKVYSQHGTWLSEPGLPWLNV